MGTSSLNPAANGHSTPSRLPARSSSTDSDTSSTASSSPSNPTKSTTPQIYAPIIPTRAGVALPSNLTSMPTQPPLGKAHHPKLPKITTQRVEPGCQPESVYEAALNPVREAFRRAIVRAMPDESARIARWQQTLRTPQRDTFFFWSAIFGTHTFFTAFLPMLFFLGLPEKGRGLLHVVGLGIYASCVAKDLACTPRPYAPPVTRLSMSTHHREYGFPSSHSTNAISIALLVGQWFWEGRDVIGYTAVAFGWVALFAYYAIIAFGRLYTGMHSTFDVIGGTVLGTVCWFAWQLVGEASEAWVNTGTLWVAGISIPLTLALVHYHPETPDDCPCFEDAIAIIAVICGSFLGHLYFARNPTYLGPSVWSNGPVWGVLTSLLRIVIGITLIFVWRLVIKSTCLRVLPTVFRLASKVFDRPLPTRRFYTAATAYKGVADAPIHTVPSFGRLATADPDYLSASNSSSPARRSPSPLVPTAKNIKGAKARTMSGNSSGSDDQVIRMRVRSNSRPNGIASLQKHQLDLVAGNSHRAPRRGTQHYDAEVLTKVIVYGGIGYIATNAIPILFVSVERYLGIFP